MVSLLFFEWIEEDSRRKFSRITILQTETMKPKINSVLSLALAIPAARAFVPSAFLSKDAESRAATMKPAIVSENPLSMQMVASSVVDNGPPTDTEEAYGTVVGDTKGAALRLDGVAISRGASPLLKNIDWSVQPNERWGIVGVNGAGKSTLLGAITGTVRMDEGNAFVHSNARVGYLKQSVSICGQDGIG